MQQEAKEKIKILVEKYEKEKSSGKLKSYSEEETKKGFIEPLFEALGWDFSLRDEISAEESISGERVDYGFYINGRIKFYLEAKKISVDLYKEEYANQAIRYSWNKGATWAILTDFESIIVFNAQDIKNSLADKRCFTIPYYDYINRFDQLWLLSKESFEKDLLDKYAEEIGKKYEKVPVTARLDEDLAKCRDLLTEKLGAMNPDVGPDLLDEGVQKLLDRLIFIRVAEDRGVEPKTLIPLAHEARSLDGKLYETMVKKFRELDEYYNSNLFSPHPFEKWDDYDWATEGAINILYGKPGYYEYDFKAMPADVLGAVYESYLGHRLAKSKKGLTVAKDAGKRKEHGIYYTPSFIVEYIVKNALGPVLDNCHSIADLKKIKVLDPACGSGSFLIRALEMINEKYKKLGAEGGTYTKVQILMENIYGVDLDQQAVEITRLNLLINALEKREKLPFLNNIKCGNSLISGTDEELEKYFGKNFKDKKPFNWQEEFSEVFKQGGFDVVIGNPPWVTINHKEIGIDTTKYYKDKYKGAEGFKLNLFPMFVELALKLLKNSGIFSFIIPNRLLDTPSYAGVRREIIDNHTILDIENLPEGSFEQVVAGNIILVIKKQKNTKNKIIIRNFHNGEILPLPISQILNNKNLTININAEGKSSGIISKIDSKNILKLKDLCDVHVGMMVKNKNEAFRSEPIYKYKIVTGRDLSRYLINNERYFDLENIDIFGGTKNKNKHLERPKLLVRKTGDTIICSIDRDGIFAEQSVYLVLLRNKNFDINFLSGILNSKLITFYFKNKLITNPKSYPYIQHYDLESIPIINVDKKLQKKIIILVDGMIELGKEFYKITENSEKWNSIKSEIEKTDKKIDEEVYRLYGLTEEEIKIVENANK